jgi:hypothetical protein
MRFALADELKEDLDPFMKDKYGISALTTDTGEKDIIRAMLVAHGKTHRIRTKGTHWVKLLQAKIEKAQAEGIVPIVSDIRYDFYEKDEVHWIQKTMGGNLVHLRRDNEDGSRRSAPNADEAENDPKVEAAANYRLILPTVLDLEADLLDFTSNFVDEVCPVTKKN